MCMGASQAPQDPGMPDALQTDVSTPELLACSFHAWYSQLSACTLKSTVLPLPQEFVAYLLADGVFVGEASKALPERALGSDTESEDSHVQHDEEEEEDEKDQIDWTERFPGLQDAIESAIQELGGKVVPKLNWSCPSDATWVNPLASLACTNADEVVLMLKSSDRVAHDLELLSQLAPSTPHTPATSSLTTSSTAAAQVTGSTDATSPSAPSTVSHGTGGSSSRIQHHSLHPTLVLRKWYDLRPEREWRCFVRGDVLVGVCQRDATQHFPQLCDNTAISSEDEDTDGSSCDGSSDVEPASALVAGGQMGAGEAGSSSAEVVTAVLSAEAREAGVKLKDFFGRRLEGRFALHDYVFDAYVATNGTVKLLDVSPVGGTTNPLLFSWEELGYSRAVGGRAEAAVADRAPEEPSNSSTSSAAAERPLQAVRHQTQTMVQASATGRTGRARRVPVRVVPAGLSVQPGQRMACGMPYDMLNLQDTVEGMVRMMQGQR